MKHPQIPDAVCLHGKRLGECELHNKYPHGGREPWMDDLAGKIVASRPVYFDSNKNEDEWREEVARAIEIAVLTDRHDKFWES